MKPNADFGFTRLIEWTLLAATVLSLGSYGYGFLEARLYQFRENGALDERLREGVRTPAGLVLGRLEIRRLRLSAIIREGDDAHTLRVAVGHIPGTASPGDAGNAVLAGHRDTFFRKLRLVKSDDEIAVTTSRGFHSYRVVATRVVRPDDLSVLGQTDETVLTLVTCYPFWLVGPAPERFIVRATISPVGQSSHHQSPSTVRARATLR